MATEGSRDACIVWHVTQEVALTYFSGKCSWQKLREIFQRQFDVVIPALVFFGSHLAETLLESDLMYMSRICRLSLYICDIVCVLRINAL